MVSFIPLVVDDVVVVIGDVAATNLFNRKSIISLLLRKQLILSFIYSFYDFPNAIFCASPQKTGANRSADGKRKRICEVVKLRHILRIECRALCACM